MEFVGMRPEDERLQNPAMQLATPLDQCYDRVLNYNITALLFIHIYIATMPHIMGSVYI